MRLLCMMFFMCCTQSIFAQKESNTALFAKLSTLSFIDPNTPALQPGLEIRYKTKWSAQAEYGLRIPFLADEIVPHKINHRYSKWRSEIKFYTAHRQADVISEAPFIALEVFGVKQVYKKERGLILDDKFGNDLIFDTATINRRTKGFCLKYGYVFLLNKNRRLTMETAAGMGLRFINIAFSDFINLREYNPGIIAAVINGLRINRNDEFEGGKTRLHLAASVKIGYRLF